MEEKYIYIEEQPSALECNTCYNQYYDFFKCKRCVFRSCPKSFNNFYFLDDVTYCPMCKC